MRRIKSNFVGIQQGSIMLFSDFEKGGKMWTGEGQRALRKKVQFKEPFAETPAVQVSLSMWDMDQKTNQRADISSEKITKNGFTILFQTWGDTRVARVRADWIAMGEIEDDDNWRVD